MLSKILSLIVILVVETGLASAESFDFTSFADPLHLTNTLARDINDTGQIVGDYESFQAVFTTGFMYQNGTFTTINFPGANYTVATGINNAGEVVGYYADGFTKVHGFTYDNGTFTTIDSPNGLGTWISGINSKGQIVGYYSDALSVFHGLVYDHGTFTTLDDPDAGVLGSTRLFGINDAGQIVGQASSPINGAQGFVYGDGQFSMLVDASNGISPTPAAINSSGEIAGTAVVNGLSYGFVYTDGTFFYFQDPAFTVTTVCREVCLTEPIPIQVSGMNNAGEIVGFHSYIDITTPVVSSFVGTAEAGPAAIPEGASAVLFAGGTVGLALLECLRRRARPR
jgi:probable HAF family extracellular repeat protein